MGEGSPGCNTHPIDRLTYLLTQRSGHGGPMARRSVASDPRRTGSSRRTSCALVALAWLLLAVGAGGGARPRARGAGGVRAGGGGGRGGAGGRQRGRGGRFSGGGPRRIVGQRQ